MNYLQFDERVLVLTGAFRGWWAEKVEGGISLLERATAAELLEVIEWQNDSVLAALL